MSEERASYGSMEPVGSVSADTDAWDICDEEECEQRACMRIHFREDCGGQIRYLCSRHGKTVMKVLHIPPPGNLIVESAHRLAKWFSNSAAERKQ